MSGYLNHSCARLYCYACAVRELEIAHAAIVTRDDAVRERDEAREWRAHYEVAHMRVTAELETVKADCRAMAATWAHTRGPNINCWHCDAPDQVVPMENFQHAVDCLAMKYAPKETGE